MEHRYRKTKLTDIARPSWSPPFLQPARAHDNKATTGTTYQGKVMLNGQRSKSVGGGWGTQYLTAAELAARSAEVRQTKIFEI